MSDNKADATEEAQQADVTEESKVSEVAADETLETAEEPAEGEQEQAVDAVEDAEEATAEPIDPAKAVAWRGEVYDFTNYDDVRNWQEKGEQHCWLSVGGHPNLRVPVADLAEAVEFQAIFHSLRPRLHQG